MKRPKQWWYLTLDGDNKKFCILFVSDEQEWNPKMEAEQEKGRNLYAFSYFTQAEADKAERFYLAEGYVKTDMPPI